MNNEEIRDFWQKHPCGQSLITEANGQINDLKKFFIDYDKFRYATEGHILVNLDKIDFENKSVLEIGIGQASDAQRIIERGANYFGVDFTQEACNRAELRFKLFNLPYESVICENICGTTLADNKFDIIYSHGALHHVPEIEKAVKEIYRILKKDGKIILMLYAKKSFNYYISIMFIRRLLIIGLFLIDIATNKKVIHDKILRGHLNNIRAIGFKKYLSNGIFLSKNTDGPENPYSRVYSRKQVKEIFNGFEFNRFEQHFLNQKHLPFLKLLPRALQNKLSAAFGWHLWCYGVKK